MLLYPCLIGLLMYLFHIDRIPYSTVIIADISFLPLVAVYQSSISTTRQSSGTAEYRRLDAGGQNVSKRPE
jgi:hypothetical protein